jgi:hypothetical protein
MAAAVMSIAPSARISRLRAAPVVVPVIPQMSCSPPPAPAGHAEQDGECAEAGLAVLTSRTR